MRLHDVVSGPWAITPEMFTEVQGIYARHCRGDKIDLQAVEAKVGAPLNNQRQPITVENGVAVIPIEGVISKKMNLMQRVSGGTSTQIVGDQFAQALADDSVTSIVLSIDSPGGTVDGTQALADQIYAARGKKPITAITDGCMCSAAYWIASAADEIFITGDTTQVGSIGVISTHVDQSMAEAQRGIKVTEIKAGKYKGTGSPHAPLGAGEAVMQDAVDHLYQVFVNTVARNRGVDVETVMQNMAEGQVFLGQKAIEAGLVDGVSTLSAVIAMESAESAGYSQALRVGVTQMASTQEVIVMEKVTIEKVRAESPEIASALRAEGFNEGKAQGVAEGSKAERERIQSVEAMSRKGHEALITEMKFDGKTTGPEAAVRILGAIDAVKATRLANMQADATDVVVPAAAAADDKPADQTQIDPHRVSALAASYVAEQAKLGVKVTDAQAVNHVLNGGVK